MKILKTAISIALITLLCNCAGTTGTTSQPSTSPSSAPSARAAAFELARAIGRMGLSAALQRRGFTSDQTEKILNEARTVIDGLIAGHGFAAILDVNLWPTARAEVITRLSVLIVNAAKDSSVPLDQETVKALLTPIVDAAAAAVRSRRG